MTRFAGTRPDDCFRRGLGSARIALTQGVSCGVLSVRGDTQAAREPGLHVGQVSCRVTGEPCEGCVENPHFAGRQHHQDRERRLLQPVAQVIAAAIDRGRVGTVHWRAVRGYGFQRLGVDDRDIGCAEQRRAPRSGLALESIVRHSRATLLLHEPVARSGERESDQCCQQQRRKQIVDIATAARLRCRRTL